MHTFLLVLLSAQSGVWTQSQALLFGVLILWQQNYFWAQSQTLLLWCSSFCDSPISPDFQQDVNTTFMTAQIPWQNSKLYRHNLNTGKVHLYGVPLFLKGGHSVLGTWGKTKTPPFCCSPFMTGGRSVLKTEKRKVLFFRFSSFMTGGQSVSLLFTFVSGFCPIWLLAFI